MHNIQGSKQKQAKNYEKSNVKGSMLHALLNSVTKICCVLGVFGLEFQRNVDCKKRIMKKHTHSSNEEILNVVSSATLSNVPWRVISSGCWKPDAVGSGYHWSRESHQKSRCWISLRAHLCKLKIWRNGMTLIITMGSVEGLDLFYLWGQLTVTDYMAKKLYFLNR